MKHHQKIHKKLVRNLIPEILEKKGIKAITSILDEKLFYTSLQDKLQEEVQEFLEAPSKEARLEELADVVEVILAILEVENTTIETLELIRLKKSHDRGDFSKKIFLEETFETTLS